MLALCLAVPMMGTFDYGKLELLRSLVWSTPERRPRWNTVTAWENAGKWMQKLGDSLGTLRHSQPNLLVFYMLIWRYLLGTGEFHSLYAKLLNSSILCWRQGESKRNGEGSIQEQVQQNRKQRERKLLYKNKVNWAFVVGFIYAIFSLTRFLMLNGLNDILHLLSSVLLYIYCK